MEDPVEERTSEQQDTAPTTSDKGCQTDDICNGTATAHSATDNAEEYCMEPGDPPLLQRQIQTSKSGIQQIIECFRSGTTQLRHILLKEVDTIFECKLCRSLFRGLPNLITHKEFYCLTRLPDPDGPAKDSSKSVAMKELLQVIYPPEEPHVVQLEPIGSNPNAVFQHVTREDQRASSQPPSRANSQPPSRANSQPPSRANSQPPSRANSQPPATKEKEAKSRRAEEKEKEREARSKREQEAKLAAQVTKVIMENDMENQEEMEEADGDESDEEVDDDGEEEEEDCESGEEEEEEEEDEEEEAGEEEDEEEEEDEGEEFTEDEEAEDQQEEDSPGKESDDVDDGSVPGVAITCCMCGKDFNSRQSIRRHCRKNHLTWMEELRKFTKLRTVPISLLSMVKPAPSEPAGETGGTGRDDASVTSPMGSPVKTPYGKSCPVCFKSFATKANVRRHFDEVHRGLKRDTITPDIATKPGEPLSLDAKPGPAAATAAGTPVPYNMASGKCLICKRKYSSQSRLKRHLRIVHKIRSKHNSAMLSPPPPPPHFTPTSAPQQTALSAGKKAVKRPASEAQKRGRPKKRKRDEPKKAQKQPKEEEEDEEVWKEEGGSPSTLRPKLALGFDFKLLYCKLCKRQFSSRQNLEKHIELHTDNDNEIFIKFYRCPLCSYETRRKRDVLRHITVVHKKPSAYLSKIMATIESRAVKKPAELVLKNSSGGAAAKRPPSSSTSQHVKEEMNGRHEPTSLSTPTKGASQPGTNKHSAAGGTPADAATNNASSTTATSPSTPVTRRQEFPPPSPPVTRKHGLFQSSPPSTRKSDHHHHTRKQETPQSVKPESNESTTTTQHSTEVRVTKNFSLHACDMCGRAFAKKLYLETHKRSHRNAQAAAAAAAAASSDDNHLYRSQGISSKGGIS